MDDNAAGLWKSGAYPAPMPHRSDPFRILGLPYDAGPDDLRRAWRRQALVSHPDLGGTGLEFLRVRAAYDVLRADLEAVRTRWRPSPPPDPGPPPSEPVTLAGPPDSRLFPTCPVVVSRGPNGRQKIGFKVTGCAREWVPGAAPPAGGIVRQRVSPADGRPAFGVWEVPLGDGMVRYVFGPAASG